jgi:hypothetical protein
VRQIPDVQERFGEASFYDRLRLEIAATIGRSISYGWAERAKNAQIGPFQK